MLVALPAEDETPDEEDRPEDDEVPEALDVTCLAVVDAGANVAPMPAAAAADSRPTCQVILLTRRRPRSLDWRAAATVAAG